MNRCCNFQGKIELKTTYLMVLAEFWTDAELENH
jgi:hypothetical protein